MLYKHRYIVSPNFLKLIVDLMPLKGFSFVIGFHHHAFLLLFSFVISFLILLKVKTLGSMIYPRFNGYRCKYVTIVYDYLHPLIVIA